MLVSVKFTNGKRLTGILNSYKESLILVEINKKVKKEVVKELVEIEKDSIKEINGVEKVDLDLVWDPPWDKSMMSEAAKLELNLW